MARRFLRRGPFTLLVIGAVLLGLVIVNSPKADATVPCIRVDIGIPISTVLGDATCMQQTGGICPFVTFSATNVSVRVDVCVPSGR
ncbi:MAG TPA: hypothetical protein VFA94_04800 [Acidimicrobiales bacterium]|nr:hypothetical protein [Acidimicrobiales bacterium]